MKVREIVPLIAENNHNYITLVFDGYWCGYDFSVDWFNNPDSHMDTQSERYVEECLDREVDRVTANEYGNINIVVKLD